MKMLTESEINEIKRRIASVLSDRLKIAEF